MTKTEREERYRELITRSGRDLVEALIQCEEDNERLHLRLIPSQATKSLADMVEDLRLPDARTKDRAYRALVHVAERPGAWDLTKMGAPPK